jgi:hypothetical protein
MFMAIHIFFVFKIISKIWKLIRKKTEQALLKCIFDDLQCCYGLIAIIYAYRQWNTHWDACEENMGLTLNWLRAEFYFLLAQIGFFTINNCILVFYISYQNKKANVINSKGTEQNKKSKYNLNLTFSLERP